jgi:N utilization substance protein B
MATARDVRRCALQVLYQFDAGNIESTELVRASLEESAGSEQTHQAGYDLAMAAWGQRDAADEAVSRLAPDWPTYRQPVIDRNILRLAHYEMTAETAPPKVVINEAVELAKEFSTEKSPLFVNGVLDKIYRSLRGEADDTGAADAPGDPGAAEAAEAADEPTST